MGTDGIVLDVVARAGFDLCHAGAAVARKRYARAAAKRGTSSA